MRALPWILAGWVAMGIGVMAVTSGRSPSPPLRMPAQPASALESALGTLRFRSPVALVTPPGETNRVFVVEQPGRILVVTNLSSPNTTVFLDLTATTVFGGEQGLLGLAFHPRHAENGRFFVFRTVTATTRGNTNRLHDRLAEFRVSPTSSHRADPQETILFQQYDQASNHNGGDLHFGPDGYLYVAVGDEGGGNDQYGNGQVITRDLFAGILRLDVDARPGSVDPNPHPANEAFLGNYRIPSDNPFVGATQFLGRPIAQPSQVRTEFFAVGLRNPWRVSFDRATGELWVGDVGQNARESIFITRRGANHGWPFREGTIAGPRTGAPGGFLTDAAFEYVAPVHVYSHGGGPSQGRSVTGGLVYRGKRFPELVGAYLFADYVSGNVWALRRPMEGSPRAERLLGETGISAFGIDPRNDDVLVTDLDSGRVLRLLPGAVGGQAIPATLAETGAFARLDTLSPADGVIPYDVNLPFWSDGAEKRRWFHVPGSERLAFRETGQWLAPEGSVWVKHFDLPLGPSPNDRRQRVETRFLVRNAGGVYGVTYRWLSETRTALVADEGETAEYVVGSGEATRTVEWRFPSRAECLSCHNAAAGGSLSFETAQLARTINGPDGVPVDQIETLARAGYFLDPPEHARALRKHPAPSDERVSLEARVRSLLAVNCSPCHRPGGTIGGGFFDTRLETATDEARLLHGLLNDSGTDPDSRVVVPGRAHRSALLQRMISTGEDRMPTVSSGVVDTVAVALLERWIASLTNRVDYASWLREYFGEAAAQASDRTRDSDGDGASDYSEYVTGTHPTRADDPWRLRWERPGGGRGPTLRFRHPAGTDVRLEASRDGASGPWVPWIGREPDGEDYAPTVDRERVVEVEADDRPLFLRARVALP